MDEKMILLIMLVIVTADFILERTLGYFNSKSAKKPIPEELKGIYDEEKYRKSQDYNRTVTNFGNWMAVLSFVVTICALYFGWFGWLDKWIRNFSPLAPVTSLIFFGILFLLSEVIGTPFSYYQNFVIEEKFGFNKMTKKTFWMDKLKGLILTIIIGGILISLLLYLIMTMGSGFWIYFWAVITLFVLFMNVFYTSLILPLFNKLTPMEEGTLYDSIKSYSEKVRFPLKNIFVMENYKAIDRNKEVGSTHSLLTKGMVPGIIYGKGSEPTKIALEDKILNARTLNIILSINCETIVEALFLNQRLVFLFFK